MWVEVDVEGRVLVSLPNPFLWYSCHFCLLGNRVVGAKCKANLLTILSQSPPLTQRLSLVPSRLTVLL